MGHVVWRIRQRFVRTCHIKLYSGAPAAADLQAMAQLAQIADILIVAVNRDILFLAADGSVSQKLVLPAIERAKLDPKKTDEDADDNEDNVTLEANADDEDPPIEKITDELPLDYGKIQHIAAASNGQLLAITTADDKAVYLYRVTATTADLLSKRESSRTSNTLCFSPDSQQLLLADKTGDCFIFECADAAASPNGKWILGHFSMVLDTIFTANGRHIISCDRDEKIRVTQYPKTHIIETYCLGHTEYVPTVAFVPTHPDSLLVSVSGDKTLRVWNYLSGVVATVFELPAPALRMVMRKVSENSSHIAVTLYGWDSLIVVYKVIVVDGDAIVIEIIDEHALEDVKDVTSMHFDASGSLIMLSITDAQDVVRIHKLTTSDGSKYVRANVDAWQTAIREHLSTANVQFNADEISLLFKKKFDNIHNYQERKKRRIETKNNKKVRC